MLSANLQEVILIATTLTLPSKSEYIISVTGEPWY